MADYFAGVASTLGSDYRIGVYGHTDNKGAMDTATIQVTVNSPSGNQPPSAALSADKVQGVVPLVDYLCAALDLEF